MQRAAVLAFGVVSYAVFFASLRNAHFEVRDVADLAVQRSFDLVTAFDAVHDQARPEAALLCAELGDRERAEALRALLEPLAHQHAMLPLATYCGPIARCVARLEETLGHLGRACDHFDEAHDAALADGARPMQARTFVEHGRALARSGARRLARERLDEGARLAAELGMTGLVRDARAAIATL